MTKTQALLPCPFCNCPPNLLIEESTGAAEICGFCHQSCWIECPGCGATGPTLMISDDPKADWGDYNAVRIAWNRRMK